MKSREEFSRILTEQIRRLPNKHMQMDFIEEIITGLAQTVLDLGLGELHMNKISKEKVEDKLGDANFTELKGKDLRDFIEMMARDGIDLNKLKDKIKSRGDYKDKIVGDSVVVIDKHAANYMHDYDTKEQLSRNHEAPLQTFIDTPAIVIEADIDFRFNCGHCDEEHRSDLVIYFPSLNKKYHILHSLVRIL